MKIYGTIWIERTVSRVFLALWDKLIVLPRSTRTSLLIFLDIILIPLAIFVALVARLGAADLPAFTPPAIVTVALTTAFTLLTFISLGLYRAVVRFMGNQAIVAVIKGVTISTVIFAVVAFLTQAGIPRSLPFIYWLIGIALIGGSRLVVRAYYQRAVRTSGEVSIIYGAGDAGRHLMSTLMHGELYRVVLFVDDNPRLLNRTVNGISVEHPRALPDLVEKYGVRYVFIAIPSLAKDRRREIIESLMHLRVHVKTVPSLEEVIEGVSLATIQEVDVDDLLGREPIPPQPSLLADCVVGKVVMVTGAGGSIGSELSRQIIQLEPKQLLLLEQSEYSLYKTEQEVCRLIDTHSLGTELHCLMASVQDSSRLEQIFEVYDIDTVYHAAAYKHVPMVEHNVLEGLKNNVLGTFNLVDVAAKHNIETFTLISTDKAVRPTNVMGASKRFAELILQAYATKGGPPRFCMVRFGNVLGSSGSVVPMFRDQIRLGGPVTVTHKDVIRYFMTIPEAAQLVLQASAMGEGGDVFLLDMGKPVKIIELARRMIWLMGREVKDENNLNGDIEIQFTGLRPGEKLYEELLIGDNPSGTGHPMIMRAEESYIEYDELMHLVNHLRIACDNGACDIALEVLSKAVPEYERVRQLHDTVWERGQQNSMDEHNAGNVISGGFREQQIT